MRKITPLVVSGASAIGKTAFSARLVKEHPDLFKLAQTIPKFPDNLASTTNNTHQENKIPVFNANEVELAGNVKTTFGQINSVFIMPPNIQALRQTLERKEEKSQASIDNTLEKVEEQVNKAIHSDLYATEDFIIHNNDFEKAYQQFKKRVFSFYKTE